MTVTRVRKPVDATRDVNTCSNVSCDLCWMDDTESVVEREWSVGTEFNTGMYRYRISAIEDQSVSLARVSDGQEFPNLYTVRAVDENFSEGIWTMTDTMMSNRTMRPAVGAGDRVICREIRPSSLDRYNGQEGTVLYMSGSEAYVEFDENSRYYINDWDRVESVAADNTNKLAVGDKFSAGGGDPYVVLSINENGAPRVARADDPGGWSTTLTASEVERHLEAGRYVRVPTVPETPGKPGVGDLVVVKSVPGYGDVTERQNHGLVHEADQPWDVFRVVKVNDGRDEAASDRDYTVYCARNSEYGVMDAVFYVVWEPYTGNDAAAPSDGSAERIRTLEAQLAAANARAEDVLRDTLEKLEEEAENRSWCSEYDEFLEKHGWERFNNRETTRVVTGSFSVEVTARPGDDIDTATVFDNMSYYDIEITDID